MALILNIETATSVCSVALSRDELILSSKESNEQNSHSSLITIFIEQILKESETKIENLDAVAISKGPGSYTGLRIGVSTAKGLCYALDKPLISIGTLQSMAFGLLKYPEIQELKQNILFCPMIDARRMEVYAAIYDTSNVEVREVRAEIIDKNSFNEYLQNSKVVFFGDGASKFKEVLSGHPNAIFIDNVLASSLNMAELAEQKYCNNQFEDLAYFEPFYLKDFIAGKPKVKGLH
ncbi:MAG: tRNA (adenosine(37)-N6)-threonylcarbamoyltransferase complex dimerization subunit type 1 TsaB [Bacteroidales bacterium]|nr:tRNA (adenosine(37)-N6)-threonylcarbamoyltransferase complex dimerization subunit type 1 TsaB [Bacteroidales bacterium]